MAWKLNRLFMNIFEMVTAKEFDKLLLTTKEFPDLLHISNTLGFTIIHSCAEIAPVQVMSELYSQGANIDIRDSENLSPFCWAVDGENFEVANFLLSAGVEQNVCNKEGRYPIHEAAFYGDISVIEYLLSISVPVNQKSSFGATALHYASASGLANTVNYLIQNNADVHAPDDNGKTPLHWLTNANIMSHKLQNYLDTIKILVVSSAMWRIKDKDGLTPWAIASDNPALKSNLGNYGDS